MTTFQQFIQTVWILVRSGRWAELAEYLALVREIINQPTAVITAGRPRDKEI